VDLIVHDGYEIGVEDLLFFVRHVKKTLVDLIGLLFGEGIPQFLESVLHSVPPGTSCENDVGLWCAYVFGFHDFEGLKFLQYTVDMDP